METKFLILSDVQMPHMNGSELLTALPDKSTPFILMTAFGDLKDAVSAIQMGAKDYLIKPFETKTLIECIERYLPTRATERNAALEDPASLELLRLAKRAAKTDATILITGESGTGKEVLARMVYEHSNRSNKPFIAINCAAIPENMLEATLFGYEKGAFTGAQQATAGKFELADKGTLLLDEISEMDLNLQAKLLRVLQEREVERLGGHKIIPLDVRVIATSNRSLLDSVKAGTFREDLYYRLNVFPLHWLPLRERPLDIIPLAEHLLNTRASSMQLPPVAFTLAAEAKIKQYPWPGNVRELDNVLQRALILATHHIIDADLIHIETSVKTSADSLECDVKQHEQSRILKALESCNGSRSQAAKLLNINPRTLRYKLAKMKKEGIVL